MNNWKDGIVYCWDTSVFFAWLKAEACHPLADIGLVIDAVECGKAAMIIPATAYEELCYSRLSSECRALFDRFIQRSNVIGADLTPPIIKKAAQVINRSQDAQLVTRLRDARIAATAIVLRATVLHSVDPDLTRLNGSEIVDGIRICKPVPFDGQRGL